MKEGRIRIQSFLKVRSGSGSTPTESGTIYLDIHLSYQLFWLLYCKKKKVRSKRVGSGSGSWWLNPNLFFSDPDPGRLHLDPQLWGKVCSTLRNKLMTNYKIASMQNTFLEKKNRIVFFLLIYLRTCSHFCLYFSSIWGQNKGIYLIHCSI